VRTRGQNEYKEILRLNSGIFRRQSSRPVWHKKEAKALFLKDAVVVLGILRRYTKKLPGESLPKFEIISYPGAATRCLAWRSRHTY
jgi:hypothetical protein